MLSIEPARNDRKGKRKRTWIVFSLFVEFIIRSTMESLLAKPTLQLTILLLQGFYFFRQLFLLFGLFDHVKGQFLDLRQHANLIIPKIQTFLLHLFRGSNIR